MAYDLFFRRQTPRSWACSTSIGLTTLGSSDPLIWTPSAVKTEMERVLNILDAVNADVSRAYAEHKISDSEWIEWRAAYKSGHDFCAKASHYWGSNVDVARQHESTALIWRKLVEERGGRTQGPRPQKPFPTTQIALAVSGVAATALLITSIRRKY